MTRSATRAEPVPWPVDEPFEREIEDEVRPSISFAEACAKAVGIFESDEEVDEFVAYTYEMRRRDMA